MNGYKAFYKGKALDVYAETAYQAQQKAAKEFKAKKSYEVTVMLCELDTDTDADGKGTQVVHRAID